jgi:hypothetical protein
VLKDLPAHEDYKVDKEMLLYPALRVLPDQEVHKDWLGLQVPKDLLAHKVHKDYKVQTLKQVLKDSPVQEALKVSKEMSEKRALLVLQAHKVPLV